MALVRTIEDYQSFTTTTSSWTSGSFSADTGDLIVVVIQWLAINNGPYSEPEWSVSSADMSFTRHVGLGNGDTTHPTTLEIYAGIVPSTASRTVTVNSGGQNHSGRATVLRYSGNSVSVRQSKETSSTQWNGAFSYNLDAAPLIASEVLAAVASDEATGTSVVGFDPGSGWTELWDVGIEATLGGAQAQARSGSTSTLISYDDINVNDATAWMSQIFGAIEIAEAADPPLDFPASPSEGDRYRQNNITYYYKNGVWRKAIPSNMAMITYGIDNDGTALVTENIGPIYVPNDFEIIRWTLIGDQSGSANVDLWSCEYGTTPNPGHSMTGNVGMTISSSTANQSGDTSSWSMKKINAGNVVAYNVQSVSTITRLTVNLFGIKGQ